MPGNVHPIPRPEWSPVPRHGCHNVEARVLLKLPTLMVVQLRFAPHGTIDEHSAPWEIDVICLEGQGTTTVDGVAEPIRAGEAIRWPAAKLHRLFTEDTPMVTLMVEHIGVERRS
jgi:quercetin dioxygenase-like cupin family protein